MLIKRMVLFAISIAFATLATANDEIYKLPEHITPTFQQITLNLDPDNLDYSGETSIDIKVDKPSDKVGFYHIGLTVNKAELVKGELRIPLTVSDAPYDIHWGTAEKTFEAGRYKLHFEFSGKVNTSSDGMYLSKFEEKNYLFTQFQDMHARRVFPGFDEPSFKIPYQLTIRSPQINTVVSNTPVKSRVVDNGLQTVEFKKTKPMPTYLIAYAVGELDSAPITGLSVPGRIYTPKGQANRTKFAVKHTPSILKTLEDYFGSPYPYEKLDFVAVPNFTHGAMENVGLVTYRSSLLLLEDEPALVDQQSPLSIIAHELAHMWYGNLVTMAWWDDLWLNEAFASHMASKVLYTDYPQFNAREGLVQESAFPADASPTTKPVKKVVKSSTDVMDGLGLNYTKGESVLQLIESLVGEKAFQSAIQAYMKKHQWGNTVADDLWTVLAEASDFDIPGMMRTYLEQPGYPLVNFELNGDVSQVRYRLAGAEVKAQQWSVPLSIKYKKNGKIERELMLLSEKSVNNPKLAEADWLFPNEDAVGYFRWKMSDKQLNNLINNLSALTRREQKNLLYNSDALLNAGETRLNQHMEVLNALAKIDDPVIARAVIASVGDLFYLVDDSNKQLFSKFVNQHLMRWFDQLGTENKESDSADINKLRSSVFSVLGQYGENEAVLERSEKLTAKYLSAPQSLTRSIASAAMRTTAKHGDKSWFDKYKQTFLANNDANVRNTIGYSMMFPQDENVTKLLDFSFDDAVSPANVIYNVYMASIGQEKQDVFYAWLEKNFNRLVEKMPSYHIARMPEFVSDSCNEDNIKLAQTFYKDRMANHEGMSRSYEVAMAAAQQCVALKNKFQPAFTQYLKAQFLGK